MHSNLLNIIKLFIEKRKKKSHTKQIETTNGYSAPFTVRTHVTRDSVQYNFIATHKLYGFILRGLEGAFEQYDFAEK